MTTSNKAVLEQMFQAFAAQDVEAAASTVTDDSVWIHHGTQKLSSVRFEGKPAVRKFFEVNFTSMKVETFAVGQMVEEGDTVVVFGHEKFTMDGAESPFEQQWVQVYTMRDGLIARMEEFATSALPSEYDVVSL